MAGAPPPRRLSLRTPHFAIEAARPFSSRRGCPRQCHGRIRLQQHALHPLLPGAFGRNLLRRWRKHWLVHPNANIGSYTLIVFVKNFRGGKGVPTNGCGRGGPSSALAQTSAADALFRPK